MSKRPQRRWRPASHIGGDLYNLPNGQVVKIKGYYIEWNIFDQKEDGTYGLIGCIPSEPIKIVSPEDISEVQL